MRALRTIGGVSVGWLGISMVADGVPALLIPHQLAASGRGAGELGLLTLGAIGFAAAAQPLAGSWSDRVGRVPVILVGLAVTVAGLAILLRPGGLVIGAMASLLGASVAQAGYQGLLPDRVPAERRGIGSGAKGLFDVVGASVAFALLAGLLVAGRTSVAVGVLAAGMVVSLGVALALLPRPHAPNTGRGQGDVAIGALSRPLARLIVARFLFLLGIYAVGRFLLLFVSERQGLGADAAAGEAGTVLAILTLVTGVAALPSGWLADRVGRHRLVLGGGLVAALGVALLPLATSTPQILLYGGLMAVGSAGFGAGSWALLADLSAGARAGRILGIANIGTAGAAAVAGAFGPVIDLAERTAPGSGYAVAFLVAGALAAVGAVIGWWPATEPGRSIRRALEVSD